MESFLKSPTVIALQSFRKPELLEISEKLNLNVKSNVRKAVIVREIAEYYADEEIFSAEDLDRFPVTDKGQMSEMEFRLKMYELEREEKERERAFELEKLRMNQSMKSTKQNDFVPSREIRLVPPFDEVEIDKYFQHFEKVAVSLEWPKRYWSLMLQSVLKGKAQQAYSALSLEATADYYTVKETILRAYELVPEAYRQKFRNLRKNESQNYVEFAHDKERFFEQWCSSKAVNGDFQKLKDLVLLEEFKRCVKDDIKSYLDEKEAVNLQQAAKLTDEYVLTHKSKFVSNERPPPKGSARQYMSQNSAKSEDGKEMSQKRQSGKISGPICHYCKKPGHVMSDCLSLKRKRDRGASPPLRPITLVKTCEVPFEENSPMCPLVSKPSVSGEIRKDFLPFVSEGFVSLDENVSPVPIRILRDTGASQSLLLESILPFSDETATGEFNLVQGIEENILSVPLHSVFLKSDLVTGQVKVGLRSSLPVKGVSLLLGNDIAGGAVVAPVQLTKQPNANQDNNDSDLFPSCAVTRAMANKVKLKPNYDNCSPDTQNTVISTNNDEINLSETFLFKTRADSHDCQSADAQKVSEKLSLSRNQLIKEQNNDPELLKLCEKVMTNDELQKSPVGYYLNEGVLMRKWRPPDISACDEWEVVHQIVVPVIYRSNIMTMAHCLPLGGHLGVNKTVNKILKHFFWPGLRKDVSNFCKTCHTCQLVGKHQADPPVAPLHPIPAFGEPFSRVIIDCVGPLPKTRLGNQYLLTIMCSSTRFPEVVPLRNIKAKTISKALIKFFSLFGLPKEIQSDQGSNFMSGIFQQIAYELGIKQITSSAYHPESQGAIERFHSTLKTMLRSFCVDNEKDWDEGAHLLLFAVRESVQESLGFSPFELVFGHQVRGPLTLLSEQWADKTVHVSLLDYVMTFKERLHKACELAKANLKSSQQKMKVWYDRKSKTRSFNPGDQVLVLFPVQSNPLKARFHGPYEIITKVNDLNYVVKTPDRRKNSQLCHINMLKPYHTRGGVVAAVELDSDTDSYSQQTLTTKSEIVPCKISNMDILQNLSSKLSHLEPEQQLQMKQLIMKHQDLFPNVPKRTSLVVHDIDVGDANPVKQHPYRMNPEKCKQAEDEIAYMLKNNLIRPSSSNWSSPCVLVPKPDNSVRFCTDFRKVNAVTKTDAYPIPRIEDCIDAVGQAKYLTKIDLLKGYWCVPLTDRAREISAFVTPSGLYEYNVLPFGLKNAPATFQRMIQSIVNDLPCTRAYLDDLVTASESWDSHLKAVSLLFEKLSKANLTVNLAKSEFGHGHITYLGYVIGQGQVAPIQAKVQTMLSFPVPINRKALRRFLGMVGYYRKFCKNFADVALPLTDLLKKNVDFVWGDQCQKAFDTLKNMLCQHPILKSPDFEKPFSIAVDASDVAAGAVLLQKDEQSNVEHPIAYFSKKFNEHQKNYSTIEKELMALIFALQHFEVYVTSGEGPLTVYTDHNPLVFLNKMKNKNRRLLNWSLLLQEFDLEIKHIRGKDNVIADCLSRQ